MKSLVGKLLALPAQIKLALAVLAAVIALSGAAALWLHFHDRGVVDRHEARVSAQVGAATQAANDIANTNDTRRQVEDAKAAVLIEESIRHAQEQHPDEVRRPAGPAVNAVADRLRERARQDRPAAR